MKTFTLRLKKVFFTRSKVFATLFTRSKLYEDFYRLMHRCTQGGGGGGEGGMKQHPPGNFSKNLLMKMQPKLVDPPGKFS
jgi:hypothetical protein